MNETELELVKRYVRWGKEKLTATQIAEKIVQLESANGNPPPTINVISLGHALKKIGLFRAGKLEGEKMASDGKTYPLPKCYCVDMRDFSQIPLANNTSFIFTFGKYCGHSVEEVSDLGYLGWVMNTIKLPSDALIQVQARIKELKPEFKTHQLWMN